MTRMRALVGLGAAALAGAGVALALASGRQPENLNDPAAMQAAMERWIDSMTPGEPHKRLQGMVGEWDTVTRVFMAPGMEPMESTGSSTFESILDGRFVVQRYKGSMMLPGADGVIAPQPMEGWGLSGYDNTRNQYVGSWVDNMGTGISTMSGSLNQDGSVLTMFGTMNEPMTGEMGKTIRYRTRFTGKDRFVFDVAEVQYGEPFIVVEVVYERRKK